MSSPPTVVVPNPSWKWAAVLILHRARLARTVWDLVFWVGGDRDRTAQPGAHLRTLKGACLVALMPNFPWTLRVEATS